MFLLHWWLSQESKNQKWHFKIVQNLKKFWYKLAYTRNKIVQIVSVCSLWQMCQREKMTGVSLQECAGQATNVV